jgi:ribosome-binding ATPase YchF (GTP1/OBG family)
MNKTLTINISGIIFNIEEDAYEKLKNYISQIKSHFVNDSGCDEIMADIEARIAEMLQAKSNQNKQVLLIQWADPKNLMTIPATVQTTINQVFLKGIITLVIRKKECTETARTKLWVAYAAAFLCILTLTHFG